MVLWNIIRSWLLSAWKPLAIAGAGILVLMRLDWLKRKTRIQGDEIRDLKSKERIKDEHERIEESGEAFRGQNNRASSADDFDRVWNKKHR